MHLQKSADRMTRLCVMIFFAPPRLNAVTVSLKKIQNGSLVLLINQNIGIARNSVLRVRICRSCGKPLYQAYADSVFLQLRKRFQIKRVAPYSAADLAPEYWCVFCTLIGAKLFKLRKNECANTLHGSRAQNAFNIKLVIGIILLAADLSADQIKHIAKFLRHTTASDVLLIYVISMGTTIPFPPK